MGHIMYIIEKEYFVIHDGNNILMYGKRGGQFVTALVTHAEFDTEAELQAYIIEHELVVPSEPEITLDPQPEAPPYEE